MKKKFTAYFLFMLVMPFLPGGLRSQDTKAGYPAEGLQVCTDRTMYISGENILVSAMVSLSNSSYDGDYSRILYCELITPSGNRLTGGKFPVENSNASGCLHIPEEAITGIYYLKSYTRYMRNGSQDHYHYIMLKIINPYKNELLTGNGMRDTSFSHVQKTDTLYMDLNAIISTDKEKYMARENIDLEINVSRPTGHVAKLCLAVVPEPAFDLKAGTTGISAGKYSDLRYYPETRGVSISGSLKEAATGRPVTNGLVSLSIIGDDDMMAIRTDPEGRFYFSLPGYSGNRDIFLCDNIPGNHTEIFIENDFCSRPVALPSPVFHLTDEEKAAAYKMAVNQKISSVFQQDTIAEKPANPVYDRPFYGKATSIIVLDAYIDLPTMEDYFNELLGAVGIRRSEGRKVFRFISDRAEMVIYDPLVLVDWVAVNDADRILAISPKALDRIELLDAPYVKGNITYGGIISFVSKNKDFAGIDLPASGTFINYQFLEGCTQIITGVQVTGNLPDSRNTVFWDPSVKTDEKGSAMIRFTAPDTPGRYIVVLREMSSSGRTGMVSREFEVIGQPLSPALPPPGGREMK